MTDLPTVDELRAIARSAFARGSFSDLAFAERELTLLGARDVYVAEFRRHELLQHGFTPPEDMMSNTTSLSPLLDEIDRLKDELQAANARAELAEQLRAEILVHMGKQNDELLIKIKDLQDEIVENNKKHFCTKGQENKSLEHKNNQHENIQKINKDNRYIIVNLADAKKLAESIRRHVIDYRGPYAYVFSDLLYDLRESMQFILRIGDESGADILDIATTLKKLPICGACEFEGQGHACESIKANRIGRRLFRLLLRAESANQLFDVTQQGAYGVVRLPESLFNSLERRYFISESTDDTKFMRATQEESDYLKSLGVQTDGIRCDWFKIERL